MHGHKLHFEISQSVKPPDIAVGFYDKMGGPAILRTTNGGATSFLRRQRSMMVARSC
jgi:hypothetical protein